MFFGFTIVLLPFILILIGILLKKEHKQASKFLIGCAIFLIVISIVGFGLCIGILSS